jgi:hypothetical protein
VGNAVSIDGVRGAALAFAAVVVLATGVWLTRVGKPYGAALLNVHKLVDLAAVIVIGIAVYQANSAEPFLAAEWLVVGASAAVLVAAFASGGVISSMQEPPVAVIWVHRIGSFAAMLLAAASTYLVATR